MVRFIYLFIFYLYYKLKYWNRIDFKGVTVVYAFKGSSIEFGNNIIINSSSLSNLVGLYQRTIIIARDGGHIQIGNNVGISGSTIYCHKNITIGNDVLIGGNCKIIDNDFHPLDTEARINDDRSQIKSSPITIGNNCFIGANSILLKGVKLGDNCIVGAGSVVSGQFPPNVILAGNPAKIIKVVC